MQRSSPITIHGRARIPSSVETSLTGSGAVPVPPDAGITVTVCPGSRGVPAPPALATSRGPGEGDAEEGSGSAAGTGADRVERSERRAGRACTRAGTGVSVLAALA